MSNADRDLSRVNLFEEFYVDDDGYRIARLQRDFGLQGDVAIAVGLAAPSAKLNN